MTTKWFLHRGRGPELVGETRHPALVPILSLVYMVRYRHVPTDYPGKGRGVACVGFVYLERTGTGGTVPILVDDAHPCEGSAGSQ